MSVLVLHNSGMQQKDSNKLSRWQSIRPQQPPRRLGHRYEIGGLAAAQLSGIVEDFHGGDGSRWKKLKNKCTGIDIKSPHVQGGGVDRMFTVESDGLGPKGRLTFDDGVKHLTDALRRSVKQVDLEVEGMRYEKWLLPWSAE